MVVGKGWGKVGKLDLLNCKACLKCNSLVVLWILWRNTNLDGTDDFVRKNQKILKTCSQSDSKDLDCDFFWKHKNDMWEKSMFKPKTVLIISMKYEFYIVRMHLWNLIVIFVFFVIPLILIFCIIYSALSLFSCKLASSLNYRLVYSQLRALWPWTNV